MITDYASDMATFFKRYCKQEIQRITYEGTKNKDFYFSYKDLETFNLTLADLLITDPDKFFSYASEGIRKACELDTSLTPRITETYHHTNIKDLRENNINTFISIEGTVRSVSEILPGLETAVYKCRKCGTQVFINKDPSYGIEEPQYCDKCDKPQKFAFNPDKSKYYNRQYIKIQAQPDGLKIGEQPAQITILATHSLVGKVTPGMQVFVSGVYKTKQKTNQQDKTDPLFSVYINANNIEIPNKEFSEISFSDDDIKRFNEISSEKDPLSLISSSVAPSIYGMGEIKQAIALQLFGGITKESGPLKDRHRGDIHVLLIGDPGIAKSHILTYTSKLAPRCIMTTAKTASIGGLTAIATKDEYNNGQWTIEAGALPMADKGIAIIDEIEKMNNNDSDALLPALEQQEIKVSKAGLNVTLQARCSLLAAANPKLGRFDEYAAIADQINMSPPLLSRFDLIFIIRDIPEQQKDQAIAEHIFKVRYEKGDKNPSESSDIIDPITLRKYIAYAKRNFKDLEITKEAKQTLIDYYLRTRNLATQNKPVPITARQLEALIRLSEASARSRLSKTIEQKDAEKIISIMDKCLREIAYDSETGTLDIGKIDSHTTKSKRDQLWQIKKVISDLYKETNEPIPQQDIISTCETKGYDPETTESVIDELSRAAMIVINRNKIRPI